MLSLGPVVYKTVETIQFVLVGLVFVAVLVLVVVVVRLDAVRDLFAGAFRIGHVPDGIQLPLLLGALAFAGAGGSANLAQSNYIRDKGYGMGKLMGRITSPFTGEEEASQSIGVGFEGTPENLARWRVWWRRANVEHALTFYLLCVFSIAALSLITYTLLDRGAPVGEGFGFIRDQGTALRDRFGPFAQHAFFATGIAVLVSTEIAILDAVSRVLTDLIHTVLLRDRPEFSQSRVYFIVLWSLITFGIAVLAVGVDEPLTLIVLAASLNAVVMALYSGLLLWLNLRSFAKPLRPSPLRVVVLVGSLAFFGYFSVLTIRDQLT